MKKSLNQKISILLVSQEQEDYRSIRKHFQAFKDSHYIIKWSYDYSESLKKVDNNEYDIFLIDYHLGSKKAVKLIRRGCKKNNAFTAILLTDNIDQRMEREAINAGAFALLEKNELKGKNLERTLHYALNHKITQQKLRKADENLEKIVKKNAEELSRLSDSLKMQIQENAKMAAIVESSDDAIIGKSIDGTITSWNKGAERLYGYKKEEIVGKPVSVLMPPSKKSDFPAIRKLLKQGKRIEHYETKRITKDKRILDVSLTISPIKNEKGKLIGASKIARDITYRKYMENNLHFLSEASKVLSSSLNYTQTLKNVAKLAVPRVADWCVIDMLKPDGAVELLEIAHTNQKKAKWAKKLREVFTADMNASTGLPKVLKTGNTEFYPVVTNEMIKQSISDNKKLKSVQKLGIKSVMIVPLCIDNICIGAITFIAAESGRNFNQMDLAMAQELADRAALAIKNAILYEEARIGIQTRDEFLNIASHELKTPITSLQLQLQILKRRIEYGKDFNTRDVLKILDMKEAQLKRLTKLINNLLDVTKINSQNFELEREETNLSTVVHEVVDRFDGSGKDSKAKIYVDVEKQIIGKWDKFKIDQVITNVISNAVKYGDNKPIQVKVLNQKSVAEIIVKDQGIGIQEKELKKIFERFERTEVARQYEGLGLGLYIANQFIRAHGGSIDVKSKPGQGSTFTIHLPIAN